MATITHNTIINILHGHILWSSTYPLAEAQGVNGARELHQLALRQHAAQWRTYRHERQMGVPAARPTPILMGFRWSR